MHITVKGMEKIDELVTKVQLLAKNPQNILGEYIARPIYNSIKEAYQTETDPVTGIKWKKLSDITLKAKKGRGRILYHHGDLQEKTTWDVKGNTAIIGTNAIAKGYAYPAVHQFGSKDGKIAKRRFLPLTDNDELSEKLVDLIEKALEKKIESLMA
ncbi:MAG: phage virion morphogenesis protein [Campylobacteraceae bacterium]|jgi:phage virion morphogenesis protein|nr:phage virion morphogenesis protein [Campylobacteraceae bacterium]